MLDKYRKQLDKKRRKTHNKAKILVIKMKKKIKINLECWSQNII